MENFPNSPIIYKEVSASSLQKNFILKYYNVYGNTSKDRAYLEKTLPNGYTSMVFHLGKKIAVSNVRYDGDNLPQHYLFGKYTDLINVNHSFGEVDTFGVIFKPGAFRHLMRDSQKIFTNKVVEVCEAFGERFRPYLHRLEDSHLIIQPYNLNKILNHRKQIMEGFFKDLLSRVNLKSEDLIDEVLEIIFQNPQGVSLKGICQKYNMTDQYLNRKFNKAMGMSVYKYARIIRFNQVIQSFDHMEERNLLQLAVDFDYHDISHLIKDFWKFTGGSPSDFLKTENKLAKFLLYR